MKKKYLVMILFIMLLMPFNVFAKGSFNVSSGSITMYPGESKTITISTSDSVGKLNISTSNNSVASVSVGTVFIDTVGAKKTFTIKANSVGSATITVVGSENYASYSDEVSLEGMTKTIKVNVVEKPVDNRSKNNNLKSLSIDGYELVKVNDNSYTLSVSNDVTSINVKATPEDEKAKVSGVGKHELKVGENTITVVVTAENGSKNNITIKVTRKDGYYLTDLERLLNDDKVTEIDIIINAEEKITNDYLEKIKASNKRVKFNYFDKNKKLLYSWIIDGSKIVGIKEFETLMKYESNNVEKISKISNYADGIYITFKHEGELPLGTKIKVYVGEKYSNSILLNIYHYAGDKLNIKEESVIVKDGYIEFDIDHCSEYFVTRAILYTEEITEEKESNLFIIISLVELIIIFILLILVVNKKKVQKKDNKKNNGNELFTHVNDIFITNEKIFEDNNVVVS